MIISFKSKRLKKLFLDDDVSGLPPSQIPKIKRILFRLNNARSLDDLREHPNHNLHPLTGDLKGFYSMSVSGNYRIVFRFDNGEAFDLDYIDYH